MQVHTYQYEDSVDGDRVNRYCLSRAAEVELDRRIASAKAIGYTDTVLMMQGAKTKQSFDPLTMVVDNALPLMSFVLYGVDPEDGTLHPVY